jgi:hypothetical protein
VGVPGFGKYRDDYWYNAYNRYPAAFYQLRRQFDVGEFYFGRVIAEYLRPSVALTVGAV